MQRKPRPKSPTFERPLRAWPPPWLTGSRALGPAACRSATGCAPCAAGCSPASAWWRRRNRAKAPPGRCSAPTSARAEPPTHFEPPQEQKKITMGESSARTVKRSSIATRAGRPTPVEHRSSVATPERPAIDPRSPTVTRFDPPIDRRSPTVHRRRQAIELRLPVFAPQKRRSTINGSKCAVVSMHDLQRARRRSRSRQAMYRGCRLRRQGEPKPRGAHQPLRRHRGHGPRGSTRSSAGSMSRR